MIVDNKILIGKADEKEVYILPSMMNRHGLIAGATGTGKSVTLKVIAESLSELGVPTFICDIKGDLSGMIQEGDMNGIKERLDSMGIADYETRTYPVHFYDIYREKGHPIRTILQDINPLLLGRVLELSEAQEGVLTIIFKWAKEFDPDGNGEGLQINDLKDLQAVCEYAFNHTQEITAEYGNVTKQSVAAIQRKLIQLEEQNGEKLFGLPNLSFDDLLEKKDGMGVMNLLECEQLYQDPITYSTFLLWLLDGVYNHLDEVGDVDIPRIVFFFEEAHLMFRDAPKALLQLIEQMVKMMRSKGVGVFFCTQTPNDIPDAVLAQLSNRIQHAVRAYTPAEMKVLKKTAESFRANENLDVEQELTTLKVGTALVSTLDEEGVPTIVERTKILPPKSSMEKADDALILQCIKEDGLSAVYDEDYDPISAYEEMEDIYVAEEAEKQRLEEEEKLLKQEEAKAKQEEREALRNQNRLAKKVRNKVENEALNLIARSARKLLKNLLK